MSRVPALSMRLAISPMTSVAARAHVVFPAATIVLPGR